MDDLRKKEIVVEVAKLSRGGISYTTPVNEDGSVRSDDEVVSRLTIPLTLREAPRDRLPAGINYLASDEYVEGSSSPIGDIYLSLRKQFPESSIGYLFIRDRSKTAKPWEGQGAFFAASTVDDLLQYYGNSIIGEHVYVMHEGTIDSSYSSAQGSVAPGVQTGGKSTLMALGLVAAGVAAWMVFGRKR